MPDLNLRNLNRSLIDQLKMDALKVGLTLRDHCVTLLTRPPKIDPPSKITKRAVADPAESEVGSTKLAETLKPRLRPIDLPQSKPPMPQRPANRPAKTPGEWCPTSKCPHNWMNSFVCEQNGGGCKR